MFNWFSVIKYQIVKNKKRNQQKMSGLKINNIMLKRISKSNSPRRKMSLNEEWYIISRELEAEEIIYQNHIINDSHLKENPTLKEIKKSAYDWNNIEKDIREFYFKCPTCEIRTSKPWINYAIKHIESDYRRQKYQADTVYMDITFKIKQIFIWLIISQSLDG